MADSDSASSSSSSLPSTSSGNANRGLPLSSRRRSGSPPSRPSTSRGYNHRDVQSTSRGVANRFRNFCITNEHPDGIVFCEPDGNVGTENEVPTNESEDEQLSTVSPSAPLWSPTSSGSSSPGGNSATTSILCELTPPVSSPSDNGTVIIMSSDDDENFNLDQTKSETKTNEIDKAEILSSIESEYDMSADENLNAMEPAAPQPQPEEVGLAAAVAAEENEVPEYLHHKKFHYKQVQAAAVARSKELSVENLRLSEYITQGQAESRLKALGDLQETQKEIDDFAAIICASNMYRLNLAKGNAAGSSTGRGRQSSLSTTSLSGRQLPAIAELHEGSQLVGGWEAGYGHGMSGGRVEYGARASTSTAAMFQTAGTSMDISRGDGINDSYPVTGMTSGRGSYFQPISPGHASSTDDYEWISDPDD